MKSSWWSLKFPICSLVMNFGDCSIFTRRYCNFGFMYSVKLRYIMSLWSQLQLRTVERGGKAIERKREKTISVSSTLKEVSQNVTLYPAIINFSSWMLKSQQFRGQIFTNFNNKTNKSFVKVAKTKLEVAFHHLLLTYRCQNYGIYKVQTTTHRQVLAVTCTGAFRLYSVLFLKSYLWDREILKVPPLKTKRTATVIK